MQNLSLKDFKANPINSLEFWDQSSISFLTEPLFMELTKATLKLVHTKALFTTTFKGTTQALRLESAVSWLPIVPSTLYLLLQELT